MYFLLLAPQMVDRQLKMKMDVKVPAKVIKHQAADALRNISVSVSYRRETIYADVTKSRFNSIRGPAINIRQFIATKV